jgi:HK97 family phage prohead protease
MTDWRALISKINPVLGVPEALLKNARDEDRSLAELSVLTGKAFNPNQLITVAGLAAFYGVTDKVGDRFGPNSLKPADQVRMLINHVPRSLNGFWRVEQRKDGLYVEGEVSVKVLRNLVVNKIEGLSVGFRTISARNTRKCRFVDLALLYEVSFVNFPAQATCWRFKDA